MKIYGAWMSIHVFPSTLLRCQGTLLRCQGTLCVAKVHYVLPSYTTVGCSLRYVHLCTKAVQPYST